MKFSTYLYGKIHLVLLYLLFASFFSLFLFLSGSSFAFITLLLLASGVLCFFSFYFSFYIQKERIKKIGSSEKLMVKSKREVNNK